MGFELGWGWVLQIGWRMVWLGCADGLEDGLVGVCRLGSTWVALG